MTTTTTYCPTWCDTNYCDGPGGHYSPGVYVPASLSTDPRDEAGVGITSTPAGVGVTVHLRVGDGHGCEEIRTVVLTPSDAWRLAAHLVDAAGTAEEG